MKKLKPHYIIEILFDTVYLLFALTTGTLLLFNSDHRSLVLLYSTMAFILAFGDAFHLLPRIFGLITDTMSKRTRALGIGKMITSITMTLFYVILYIVWQYLYAITLPPVLSFVVFILATLRIALCLLPQNGWCELNPPFRFSLYRNIPFVFLGAIPAALFAYSAFYLPADGFRWMWFAIILSFVFYFIVILGTPKNKKWGAFMLPKTCVYLWMLSMGFQLI